MRVLQSDLVFADDLVEPRFESPEMTWGFFQGFSVFSHTFSRCFCMHFS